MYKKFKKAEIKARGGENKGTAAMMSFQTRIPWLKWPRRASHFPAQCSPALLCKVSFSASLISAMLFHAPSCFGDLRLVTPASPQARRRFWNLT